MDEKTFKDLAYSYWTIGLSALPVRPGSKQPAVENWTSYQSNLPQGRKKRKWVEQFGDHGIGVNTGTEILPGEILVAIDVDDDKLVGLVSNLLGSPSCTKRGQKGLTLFCRAQKSDEIKATTLKGNGAVGNIDILVGGRFTVLPPTIHPTTGKPYTWITQSLLNIDFVTLPVIDKRLLGLIKRTVESEHTGVLTTGKATHNAGVALVALLMRAGATDGEIAEIIRGLLPAQYAGNSLDELPEWISSARNKGFGSRTGVSDYDPGDIGPIPLGFTKDGNFAVRDPVRGIIVVLSSSQALNMQTLMGLAPSEFWADLYPRKGSFNAMEAGEALMQKCRKEGPFDPSKVRGRGVWKEGDGIFANLGQQQPPASQHQYLAFSPIPVPETTEFDTEGLQNLFRNFPFKDPNNADLLLGWLSVAPLCGALDWRPHGFLFGPPNSGKTTLHNLAARLLTPIGVSADGQSTEAGIRQALGPDALPVVIDEFETDSHHGRLQGVMRLARSASSADSPLLRGTPEGKAMQFSIKTMMMLSAVNVTGMSPADQSRFIIAELKAHENDPEIAARIVRGADQFGKMGPAWCGYMIGSAPQVLESIETLKTEMSAIDSRLRQTMATLLAGLFVALNRRAPTAEETKAYVEQYHGTIMSHHQDQDRDNARECLEHLMSHSVRNAEGSEYSLGYWIAAERVRITAGSIANTETDSERILDQYQIRFHPKAAPTGFLIRNGAPPIDTVFRGTKWANGAWQRALNQLPGAFKLKDPQHFAGLPSKHRSVGLPLEYVPLPDEDPDEGALF